MASIKTALKSFAEPKFWLDALTIIAGYKASDLAGAMVGSRLPGPAALKAFYGPALVLIGASLVGGNAGRNLKLGAAVHAGNTVLGMTGLPGL